MALNRQRGVNSNRSITSTTSNRASLKKSPGSTKASSSSDSKAKREALAAKRKARASGVEKKPIRATEASSKVKARVVRSGSSVSNTSLSQRNKVGRAASNVDKGDAGVIKKNANAHRKTESELRLEQRAASRRAKIAKADKLISQVKYM